jgi:WD40 repeat protein
MGESSKRASDPRLLPGAKKTKTPDRRPAMPHGDGAARLLSKTTSDRVFTEVWKETSALTFKAFLLTATRDYIGGRDKIRVYHTATRQVIREIAHGGGLANDISQSRDGKSLFVACEDGTARIIDLATEKEVILRGHTAPVRCIIQGEGTDVLTRSHDHTVRRWNSSTGVCLATYVCSMYWALSVLYDEATKRIVLGLDDRIIVLNYETGERIGMSMSGGGLATSLVRVNSTTIASCAYNGDINLWDIATLAHIKKMPDSDSVWSVAATPDGQHLITGSEGNKVKVWSVATGQCVHTLLHHSNWVMKVAVSPDGRFIASGGLDDMFHLLSVSPPFSFTIREGVLVHDGKEESVSLYSDGVIRSNGDVIATVASTSTCSIVSETHVVIDDSESVEFAAPSASSAQLWSEAIGALAADLALHPEDRTHSAEQMIRRYRFNLLQTILVHLRNWNTRQWCIPREIVQIVGGYCVRG